jgi:hypothetical protein
MMPGTDFVVIVDWILYAISILSGGPGRTMADRRLQISLWSTPITQRLLSVLPCHGIIPSESRMSA